MNILDFITNGGWVSTIVIAAFCIIFIVLTYVLISKRSTAPKGDVVKSEKKDAAASPRAKTLAGVKKAVGSFAARGENKAAFGVSLADPKAKKDTGGIYVDAVVVGYYGATVFVGCDLSGDVYLDESAGEISCVVLGEKMRIENPYLVAKRAAKAVRDILRKHDVYRVPVNEVVVMTNKRAKIIAPRSLEYYTPKTLSRALASAPYTQDNGVDVSATFGAITQEVTPE